MNLRIVSGEFGGRRLRLKDGAGNFRPTAERTRTAVCETVKSLIPGCAAADVCAGSGAMGFEMLSRGASCVDFVEADRGRAAELTQSAQALGADDRCRVICRDVRQFVKNAESSYSIVFYDPPYREESLIALLPDILRLVSPAGTLIYEHADHDCAGPTLAGLHNAVVQTRRYGDTAVEYIRRG